MIRNDHTMYVLNTDHTTYAFRLMDTGHLEHLYYGERISLEKESEAAALTEKIAFQPGNAIIYDEAHPEFTLENIRLEMSSYGKGDIREPFLEVIHADGSCTSDFLFQRAEIREGKSPLRTLPSSDAEPEEGACELVITLKDPSYDLELEMTYAVFERSDVITRSSRLINKSREDVTVTRLLSTQVDFEQDGYILSTFNGAWAREMNRYDTPVNAGKVVNSSYTGSSSNRANPFVMLSRKETSENFGPVYGFNLIYSGNHYEACEVSSYRKTRFVSGINPQSFRYLLKPGEELEAPEAVMTYSSAGFNGMSQHMHDFVRRCILRGEWKNKLRPVLLNSWEAGYFKITGKKLLKLAKKASEAGIELFVMDDGWFGERNDDSHSLGDWTENRKKLGMSLKELSEKIRALGLSFGLWVEPEMVNVNSHLYETHPDWVMQIPDRPHSEGRHQRILDLSNPAVTDYLIQEMSRVFSSADISYVKWDMNRIFSDVFSPYLPAAREGETAHRYILGLYHMMDELTRRFPHILFEGCAAGGNRFDLGILCYFPQIWGSDDTDALERVRIQTGYSYGYPLSTVSAHVSSCPNHQTLRKTPLKTRFDVAAFGILGYECNLCDLGHKKLQEIKDQVNLYKKWRPVLQSGRFYRGRNGNIHEWTCVSRDRTKAVGLLMQELVRPDTPFEQFRPQGLKPDARYRLTSIAASQDLKNFGDLINTASPIHVKQDSLIHNLLSDFVSMPGEKEDVTASGSLLMQGGFKCSQAFTATGYSENVRYFQDFESRLYFMEETEGQADIQD